MKLIFISIIFIFSTAANAAYVVLEPTNGRVAGIGNLDIGGVLYNVDFGAGYFGTFGGDHDFWQDLTSALDAVDVVIGVLEAEGFTEVANGVTGIFGVQYPDDKVVVATFGSTGWESRIEENSPYSTGALIAGTTWSVATVPVPAAAWLFGSALIGLAAIKRKK